jgi:DNA-binding transcriptional MerR regulator
VSDGAKYNIGQLARRIGVTVRTIRFWSDAGVVPCAGRSTSGYRLYDAAGVARLDLVQTLRDLGLGLDTVRRILAPAQRLPMLPRLTLRRWTPRSVPCGCATPCYVR